METLDAIRAFTMYRGQLSDRKIAEDVLGQIIDAARWAPSGHNSQPWEWAVVDDRDTIDRIADIAMKAYDVFLASSPHVRTWAENFSTWLRWSRDELERRGDGIFFKRWTREQWEEVDALIDDDDTLHEKMLAMFGMHGQPSPLIVTAPCLIFTLLDTDRQIPDYSREMLELTSAGAAMQNLRLAARELGVAVHEQSHLCDLPEVRSQILQLLGFPERYRMVGAMRAGYRTRPVRAAFTHVRRPVRDILHRNRFSSP